MIIKVSDDDHKRLMSLRRSMYSGVLSSYDALHRAYLMGYKAKQVQEVIDKSPVPEFVPVPVAKTVGRLSQIQAVAIREALERTNGNKTHAAKLLGIQRQTLLRWLGSPRKDWIPKQHRKEAVEQVTT